jgi:hypothetical protein
MEAEKVAKIIEVLVCHLWHINCNPKWFYKRKVSHEHYVHKPTVPGKTQGV